MLRFLIAALLSLALSACHRGRDPRPAAALPPAARLAAPPACPAVVEGAHVTLDEADGVLSLRFTTTEEDVDELRRRVRAMAEQHNRMHERMAMTRRRPASVVPPSFAEVEEIDQGARLVLRPRAEAVEQGARRQPVRNVERACIR